MAIQEKQRSILQIFSILAPEESRSDVGLVAVDDEGKAWICWYASPGDTTDWEMLPSLPSRA